MDFYSENAADFFQRTRDLDLSVLYAQFQPYLPEGGRILDAGCGSGRDSRYFLNQGYVVHAIDAAPVLAEQAGDFIGQAVEVVEFDSFQAAVALDGIWACASLLHTPEAQLPKTVSHLASFLKPGGVFYMSFKYGDGERVRGSRMFTDMDEAGLERLVAGLPGLRLEKFWITEDRRVDRGGERWMNIIWIK